MGHNDNINSTRNQYIGLFKIHNNNNNIILNLNTAQNGEVTKSQGDDYSECCSKHIKAAV